MLAAAHGATLPFHEVRVVLIGVAEMVLPGRCIGGLGRRVRLRARIIAQADCEALALF